MTHAEFEKEVERRRLDRINNVNSRQDGHTHDGPAARRHLQTTEGDSEKKKQRLDIGDFPKQLSEAGVRATMSRKYVANLEPGSSIYNYYKQNTLDGTLKFQDAEPGGTECFTTFYENTFDDCENMMPRNGMPVMM